MGAKKNKKNIREELRDAIYAENENKIKAVWHKWREAKRINPKEPHPLEVKDASGNTLMHDVARIANKSSVEKIADLILKKHQKNNGNPDDLFKEMNNSGQTPLDIAADEGGDLANTLKEVWRKHQQAHCESVTRAAKVISSRPTSL